MVKDHSENERGNLLPPLHEILFSIGRKAITYHSLWYTSAWSTGWSEKQLNESTKSGALYHRATSRSPNMPKFKF